MMHIGNSNRNSYIESSKTTHISRGSKKHGRTKPLHDSPPPQAEKPAEDSVEISTNVRWSPEEVRNEWKDIANQYQMLSEQFENARAQGDAIGESMKERMKCLLIAMRIMSGDKVPIEDQRFLMKNDPGLYLRAIMMKTEKKNPKKHKRLSEDEEPGGNEGVSAPSGVDTPSTDTGTQAEGSADTQVDAQSDSEA